MQLNYVLISDGTSDRALLPVIDFTLRKYHATVSFKGERADFSRLLKKPKSLSEKIESVVDLFNPPVLFVHRDAENEKSATRLNEIEEAIQIASKKISPEKEFIKIIPVKMTEAWLLFNEKAIRKASGNPNGNVRLNIPKIKTLESIQDPKSILEKLIKDSSQLSARRLKALNLRFCIQLVSQNIDDFTPLNNLKSYNHFEEQIKNLKFT